MAFAATPDAGLDGSIGACVIPTSMSSLKDCVPLHVQQEEWAQQHDIFKHQARPRPALPA